MQKRRVRMIKRRRENFKRRCGLSRNGRSPESKLSFFMFFAFINKDVLFLLDSVSLHVWEA